MTERTRVITIQVTKIGRPSKMFEAEETKARIKSAFFDADDVQIDVKDFDMDKIRSEEDAK